jgi:hypothetical protein
MADERRQESDNEEQSSFADDGAAARPGATDDTVRSRAYELYERRGAQSGGDLDDWLEAERELRSTQDDE